MDVAQWAVGLFFLFACENVLILILMDVAQWDVLATTLNLSPGES